MHPALPHSTPLVTLAAAQPFDLALSLRAMSGFAPCAASSGSSVPWCARRSRWPTAARWSPRFAPAERGVSVVLHSADELSGAERHQVEVAVGRWLSLADDTAPFLAAARADPAMAPVLAETEGLHQLRFASVAEGACYFVLAQRTSQAQAGGRKRRLARVYGSALDLGGITYRAFPTLERLAELSVGELAPFTANLRQSEYLAAVLGRLASWPLGWGYRAGTDELMAELRDIRGVGEFTASGDRAAGVRPARRGPGGATRVHQGHRGAVRPRRVHG